MDHALAMLSTTHQKDIDFPVPNNDVFTINMSESLKVGSYNCRGFPKTPSKLVSKPTIKLLLDNENIDILCLQETFLSKQDLSCLNVIHKDFQGIGASSTDTRDKLISGHPYGGVAILYKTKFAKCISPIYFNLDWVIGISINSGRNKHVILCVYLKSVSGGHDDHNEIYQAQLEELQLCEPLTQMSAFDFYYHLGWLE